MRNVRKISIFGLFFLLLICLSLPQAGKAIEKKGDVYELVFSDHNPPVAPPHRSAVHWLKEVVEKQTGGKVTFKVIAGGALMQEAEAFRGVQTGIADMALYVLNPREGFLLNTVVMLPFMGWPSREVANEIYEALLKKFPQMEKEWGGVKHFAYSMMPETHIHTVKKPVKTMKELKGLKLLTTGEHTTIVKALGAAPVEVPIGDWFTALERGVADGCLNHFAVLAVFRLLELLPNHLVFGTGGVNMVPVGIIMNEKTWNTLPPDIQKVFNETQREFTKTLYYIEKTEWLDNAMKFCKEKNHNFVNLTEAEVEQWRNAVKKDIIEKWIKDMEAKKLPGKSVYDETLKLITERKKK